MYSAAMRVGQLFSSEGTFLTRGRQKGDIQQSLSLRGKAYVPMIWEYAVIEHEGKRGVAPGAYALGLRWQSEGKPRVRLEDCA